MLTASKPGWQQGKVRKLKRGNQYIKYRPSMTDLGQNNVSSPVLFLWIKGETFL
jgi:hypothetical protein